MRGYGAPYIKLYLVDQGFSGTLMGSILSVAALVELLLIPVLSRFSDEKKQHRSMWRGMVFIYVIACLVMIAFPYTAVLGLALLASEVSKRTTLVYSLQLSFTKIQQTGQNLHGRVRSMAAGGYMFANATAGILFGIGQYVGLFIAAGIAGLMSVYASKSMPEATFNKDSGELSESTSKRSSELYVFLFAQFLVSIGMRGAMLFWLIHFQENLGLETWQIALLITISSLLEIPWMLYMDHLLKRYLTIYLYLLGLISMVVFWILVGAVPSFIWAIAILMLRAPAFSLTNVATLYFINKVSAPKNVATNLTLSQITIPGVAGLISSAPMGYAYDVLPSKLFFGLCAGVLILGAITIFTYHIVFGFEKNKPAKNY